MKATILKKVLVIVAVAIIFLASVGICIYININQEIANSVDQFYFHDHKAVSSQTWFTNATFVTNQISCLVTNQQKTQ